MELIIITVQAVLLPVLSITFFLIGYNVNAPRKIFAPKPKKAEPTEDEVMLERIDNARI